MRVVQVASYFPSHLGGLELVAARLAVGMAERGFDVELFAAGDPAGLEARPGLRYQCVRSIDPLDRLLGLPMPVWHPADLWRMIRAIRGCDLVHVHDFLYLSSLVALIAAGLSGKPVILTQHISPIPYRSAVLRALFWLATQTVGRGAFALADAVAFVGPTAASGFGPLLGGRARACIVPNGVDHEVFRSLDAPARAVLRAELGLDAAKPLFVFAGRFVEKKGVTVLREALGRDSPAQWVFVGDGPLTPAAWGHPAVRVVPSLPQAELARYYQCADAVVCPGAGEGGVPLVVQEALSCGTPVLVSDDIARALDGDTGAFCRSAGVAGAGASAAWAALIRTCAAEGRWLSSARDAAAAHAARWHWRVSEDSYGDLYREAIARRARPR
jgi:glycosyltransferase involved in cell wall biosynthesis